MELGGSGRVRKTSPTLQSAVPCAALYPAVRICLVLPWARAAWISDDSGCLPPMVPLTAQRAQDLLGVGPGVQDPEPPSPLWPTGHTPALACAPNKDVADCLALILSTMKPFPPKDAVSPFSFSLLKNCGIAAAKTVGGCGALPHGTSCPYSQERHGAIGLDGCYSE